MQSTYTKAVGGPAGLAMARPLFLPEMVLAGSRFIALDDKPVIITVERNHT